MFSAEAGGSRDYPAANASLMNVVAMSDEFIVYVVFLI